MALRRLTWNFSSSAGAVIAGGYLVSSLKGTSKAFPGVHAGQTDVFPLPLGPDAGHTRHHGSHSAQSDRLRISLQRPDGARRLSATWSIGIIFSEYLKVSKRPLPETFRNLGMLRQTSLTGNLKRHQLLLSSFDSDANVNYVNYPMRSFKLNMSLWDRLYEFKDLCAHLHTKFAQNDVNASVLHELAADAV